MSISAVILGMTAACTVHQSGEAPPLTGPSTFAQSISVTATPDLITQDGQSQSAINVRVFDANGRPVSAVPVRVDILVSGTLVDYGSLSTKSIVTGTDGRATTVYTAPPPPPPTAQISSMVTIRATPLGTDGPGSAPFSADIRLVPPGVILPPAETPTPDFVVTPTPVNFNVAAIFDASTSCGGAVANGGCSGSSAITSYTWTFGDGSLGTGKTVSHTFVTTGTFNATLTVTNDRGLAASKTQAITVGATDAPTAQFTFSPTNPVVDQQVVFDSATSTSSPGQTIVTYAWNFGDGTPIITGASRTIAHSFPTAQTYTVNLVVTDNVGRAGSTQTTVPVASPNPTARLSLTKAGGTNIIADGSASSATGNSTIVIYSFDWGGSSTSGSASSAPHSYASPGAFTVVLTVTDSSGRLAATSQTITVP